MTSLQASSSGKLPSMATSMFNEGPNVVTEASLNDLTEILKEDTEDQSETSHDDLWDMDGDMTVEQIAAAVAEEKRRKKVR